MLASAAGYLSLIRRLLRERAHGALGRDLLMTGAQWADFAGWLHQSAGAPAAAAPYQDLAVTWARVGGQARATYGAVMRQAVAQHEFDRRLRREDEIRSAATAILHALSSMFARAFSLAEQRASAHEDTAGTAGDLLRDLTTGARETRSLVLVYEDLLDDEAVDRVLEACALASGLPSRPESNLGPALEGIDLAMRTLKAVKRGEPIPPVQPPRT
ncbi:hypothetical protein F5972_09605 [Microbispora cellulosiformans]|uniref:Uncharacterized protein n=1 Tax=Microbispora cellulosiformans TaxID=2614688 RepID=A0A5J5K7U2_9ACTN|nr:hypothetical protein [Microbispora cellulosiformans]KAA9379878.1 hypothetical protein F5972_09605 [Microbispora cellulosiformans]